jgi:3-oxoadipate CoA-transferase, alpha subunit
VDRREHWYGGYRAVNKIVSSVEEAIADIPDGATIMVAGFGAAGHPANLIRAVIDKGARDLTVVCNAFTELMELVSAGCVRRAITSFPQAPRRSMPQSPVEDQVRAGTLEIELVPEGTLAERIHLHGLGIPGFYSPVGADTDLAIGREVREIGGKQCILEHSIGADFALIKGYKADRLGNVVYRKASRNINPMMAMAARVTIVEVEHIVELGELDPSHINTPGIFVNRVVRCDKIAREFVAPYFVNNPKRSEGSGQG